MTANELAQIQIERLVKQRDELSERVRKLEAENAAFERALTGADEDIEALQAKLSSSDNQAVCGECGTPQETEEQARARLSNLDNQPPKDTSFWGTLSDHGRQQEYTRLLKENFGLKGAVRDLKEEVAALSIQDYQTKCEVCGAAWDQVGGCQKDWKHNQEQSDAIGADRPGCSSEVERPVAEAEGSIPSAPAVSQSKSVLQLAHESFNGMVENGRATEDERECYVFGYMEGATDSTRNAEQVTQLGGLNGSEGDPKESTTELEARILANVREDGPVSLEDLVGELGHLDDDIKAITREMVLAGKLNLNREWELELPAHARAVAQDVGGNVDSNGRCLGCEHVTEGHKKDCAYVARTEDEDTAAAWKSAQHWQRECDRAEAKVQELEAQVASHKRYRELVKTNLAETEWKKENERLKAELATLRARPDSKGECDRSAGWHYYENSLDLCKCQWMVRRPSTVSDAEWDSLKAQHVDAEGDKNG